MKLIRVINGKKEEVFDTGSRQKLNNRMKTLRNSQRGKKVRAWGGKLYKVMYKIVEDDYSIAD